MIHLFLLVLLPALINCAEPNSPRTAFKKSLTQFKQLRKQEQKSSVNFSELLTLFTKVPAEKLDSPLSDLKQKWDAVDKKHLDARERLLGYYPDGTLSSGPLLSVFGSSFKSAEESLQRANKDLAAIEGEIKAAIQKSIESD